MTFQIPKVHFTLVDIAKAANHENGAKWTDLDGVPELLPEFKDRLTIKVVHCGRSRLLSRDHNELLSVLRPLHILDLVIEHRNEFTVFSFVDSDVLKCVLAIVTFAR